jgi:hypothetical protein
MRMRIRVRFLTLMQILFFTLTVDPDLGSQNEMMRIDTADFPQVSFRSLHKKWTLLSVADPDPSILKQKK